MSEVFSRQGSGEETWGLWSPGCPRIHYIDDMDHAGLKLTNPLPLPPDAGIKSMCHHAQLIFMTTC